jgi:tetratricopeptide (TPR) repeat protein
MGHEWNLAIEAPKPLHGAVELALLQEALARSPDSAPIALQLATRLLIDDRFAEVIALLEPREDLPGRRALFLIQAYFAQETEAANRKVLSLAEQELPRTADLAMQARLLADMGKALIRLDRGDAALDALHRALALNSDDRNAFKRITALHLHRGEPQAVIALAERMLAQGVAHSRLFASLVLAKAKAGDSAAAHAIEGRDTLMHTAVLPPPPGWDSLEEFNAALAEQLRHHPALRFDRYGAASTRTWRIDTPAMAEAPLVAVLQQHLAGEVATYAANLQGNPHPWVRNRPTGGMLHNWCVLTDADGQEEWHVHQNGWLSGTYYVAVPEVVQAADDDRGCLIFGLPDDLAGPETAAEYGRYRLRPEPGMLTLFPSHCYHRTYPHGADTRRICLAFDIWPH